MTSWLEEEINPEDLPEQAWDNTFDVEGPLEVNDYWIKRATPIKQLAAMRGWFSARFEDPALRTPWTHAEGGHHYIDGGPYQAGTELLHRFGHLVNSDVLDHLVEELDRLGPDWAAVPNPERSYDPDYTPFEVGTLSGNRERFEKQVADLLAVLDLQGPWEVRRAALHLSYSAIIGSLEAYLWETAVYMLRGDFFRARQILASIPELSEQKMTLAHFLREYEDPVQKAEEYLQRIVWHRWDAVAIIYKKGLGFASLPSFRPLAAPLERRHHIIHRNGRDRNGLLITVSKEEVHDLVQAVRQIVDAIDMMARDLRESESKEHSELPFDTSSW